MTTAPPIPRIGFLLSTLGASGGVGVVLGHVRRLDEHGFDAHVVLTDEGGPAATDVPIQTLREAREQSWDILIGTWWETAEALFTCPAKLRVMFLQSLEERFYSEREILERLGAGAVLGLPTHFIAVAEWLRRVVAELRPDACCEVVSPGIDKEVFAARAQDDAERGALRVLVDGHPDLWFKAVPDAVAATRAMNDPVRVTVVAPGSAPAGEVAAARFVGGIDAAGMAALYRDHDVVLKLSRVEGLGLVPIEAMHVGVPAVVTPYTGHEEYLRHGENGLVVGFDDHPGTAAALDRLSRNRALLRRLGDGARRTAEGWPGTGESTAALAAALRRLMTAPPPDAAAAARQLGRRQRLAIELGRAQLGELRYQERRADSLQEALREALEAHERAVAQIGAIRAERAYRAATRLRTLLQRVSR